MRNANSELSAFDRHSLFEACAREAERLGGDERTAEYFFGRAQTSRVWLSAQGAVTIADMDIADWCSAIAWSAPSVARAPKQASKAKMAPLDAAPVSAIVADTPRKKQPRSGARAKGERNSQSS